jgi:hypothetical protein
LSEDFISRLLSRIAERADRETVSSDRLRLSGYEFLGLIEYAAEAMSDDLGIAAGDVVGIRTLQGPIGLVIRYAAFTLGAIVFSHPRCGLKPPAGGHRRRGSVDHRHRRGRGSRRERVRQFGADQGPARPAYCWLAGQGNRRKRHI